MIMLSPAVAALVAVQSPAALGTVLANAVFDRDRIQTGMPDAALRDGWTSRDASTDTVMMAVFMYDREFTASGQTILVHTNPEIDYVVATSKLHDETEIECVIAGPGFELVTRSLFRAGWSDWISDAGSTVALPDLLRAMGR